MRDRPPSWGKKQQGSPNFRGLLKVPNAIHENVIKTGNGNGFDFFILSTYIHILHNIRSINISALYIHKLMAIDIIEGDDIIVKDVT